MRTSPLSRVGTLALSAALAFTLSGGIASADPADKAANAETPAAAEEITTDGPHIEELDQATISEFNKGLSAAGAELIEPGTTALEYQPDGSVIGHKSDGSTYQRHAAGSAPTELPAQKVATAGLIPQEIKDVVGACLGISAGATGLWAGIAEQVGSWDKAVKFVVRRVGVVAAVSCMGGIVWHYI